MIDFSAWILSITGVVVVGLLVDIILPSGKTGKLIKSVLSILSIFLIVSPLKEINLNNISFHMFDSRIEIDKEFIKNREVDVIQYYETSIVNNLDDSGYHGVDVAISTKSEGEKLLIKTVFVDLKNLVLSDENLNIDKYTNIVAIIKKTVSVSEEDIIFYE